MDYYKGTIPILEDVSAHRDVLNPKGMMKGLVPRDYSTDPQTMFASPDQMQIIPSSEWDARYDEQEAQQSSLEHLYLNGPNGEPAFVNLDQNGFPDCWCHSTTHSVMFDRLVQGLPYLKLNAVAIATLLNQTSGGWCGLSAKFIRENGVPVVGTLPGQWPYQSRKGKDSPELRAAMALHKITEDWVDLTQQEYNQNLTKSQIATCHFNNIPTPNDFNWWGHSVCAIRTVRISAGEWGVLILNSWLNWGRHGLAVLRGSQAVANGAVATRMTTASAA